jgi:hypothetical protein
MIEDVDYTPLTPGSVGFNDKFVTADIVEFAFEE